MCEFSVEYFIKILHICAYVCFFLCDRITKLATGVPRRTRTFYGVHTHIYKFVLIYIDTKTCTFADYRTCFQDVYSDHEAYKEIVNAVLSHAVTRSRQSYRHAKPHYSTVLLGAGWL